MNDQPSASTSPTHPLALAAMWTAFAAMAFLSLRTISNLDFWQHIANGNLISSQGLSGPEAATLMSTGQKFTSSTWLYDLLMKIVYGIGGGGLVTILHTCSLCAAFGLLMMPARKHASANAIAISLLLLTWVSAARFEARPVVFSLFIPALMIRQLSAEDLNWKKAIILLAPLQILWTNLHPGFILGPILALAVGVGILKGQDNEAGKANDAFIIAGILAVATLLNPSLLANHAALFQSSDVLSGMTMLWTDPQASLVYDKFDFRPTPLLTNLTLGLGALGLIFYKKRLPLGKTLVAILGALLAVLFHEHAFELFPLLVFPFLCVSMDSIGGFLQTLTAGRGGKGNPILPLIAGGIFTLLALGTVVSTITNGYYVRRGSLSSFGLGVNEDVTPSAAAKVLERDDFPTPFLHLPMDGAYLVHALEGKKKVYTDMRVKLHGKEALTTYVKALTGEDPEAAKKLFEGKSDQVPQAFVINCLAPHSEDLISRLVGSGSWGTAWFDGSTIVLVARSPAHAALLNDKELQSAGLALLEETRKNYEASIGGIKATPVPGRLIGAAAVFAMFKEYKAAVGLYSLLQSGCPNMDRAWLQKGMLLMQGSELDKAHSVLEEAVQRWPKNMLSWLYYSKVLEKMDRKAESEEAKRRAVSLGYTDPASTAEDGGE